MRERDVPRRDDGSRLGIRNGQDGRFDRLSTDVDAFFRRLSTLLSRRFLDDSHEEIIDFGGVSRDVHHDGEAGFLTGNRNKSAGDLSRRKSCEVREIQPETIRPRLFDLLTQRVAEFLELRRGEGRVKLRRVPVIAEFLHVVDREVDLGRIREATVKLELLSEENGTRKEEADKG